MEHQDTKLTSMPPRLKELNDNPYIEQTLVRIFRILQYTYMMCKTNAKKFH